MEAQEAAQEVLEDQEVWKSVPGYEGFYEVSDKGRVRSLDRVVETSAGQRRVKGRAMKLRTTKGGYRRASLWRNGEVTSYYVHRLVWVAFNGPIPEGMQIDHLNNLPDDNRLENLQMVTPKENIARKKLFGTSTADLVASGKHHEARKSHCPAGHEHFIGNSVPGLAKRGWRSCLICDRSRAYIRQNNIPEADHWKIRDYYLERFLLEESENV